METFLPGGTGTGKRYLMTDIFIPGVLFRNREEIFEDGHCPLAQPRFEVVEDQVGIGLRHGS
jgi:hypothetical protein